MDDDKKDQQMLDRLPNWKKQPRPYVSIVNEAENRGHFVTILCKVLSQQKQKFVTTVGDGQINIFVPADTNIKIEVGKYYQFQGNT